MEASERIMKPLQVMIDAYYRLALKKHNGNMTHAAKTLGVSVRTLQRWKNKQKVA